MGGRRRSGWPGTWSASTGRSGPRHGGRAARGDRTWPTSRSGVHRRHGRAPRRPPSSSPDEGVAEFVDTTYTFDKERASGRSPTRSSGPRGVRTLPPGRHRRPGGDAAGRRAPGARVAAARGAVAAGRGAALDSRPRARSRAGCCPASARSAPRGRTHRVLRRPRPAPRRRRRGDLQGRDQGALGRCARPCTSASARRPRHRRWCGTRR